MNTPRSAQLTIIAALVVLAACGNPTAGPSTGSSIVASPSPNIPATPTRDPCDLAYVGDVVKPINDVMLQFDDYAVMAQYADKAQLPQIIPNMQAIRRVAQGRVVPECMLDLQRQQVAYMDATLSTLIEFGKPDPKAGTMATGIVQAQFYHQQYALELARLLRVTLTPGTVLPPGTTTPQP